MKVEYQDGRLVVGLSHDELKEHDLSIYDLKKAGQGEKIRVMIDMILDCLDDDYEVMLGEHYSVQIIINQEHVDIHFVAMESSEDGVLQVEVFSPFHSMNNQGSRHRFFRFSNFDDMLGAVRKVYCYHRHIEGSVYYYQNTYVFALSDSILNEVLVHDLYAIFTEYGSPIRTTEHVLKEYGNCIIENDAIKTLNHHFN